MEYLTILRFDGGHVNVTMLECSTFQYNHVIFLYVFYVFRYVILLM